MVICSDCKGLIGIIINGSSSCCSSDILCYHCADSLAVLSDTICLLKPGGYTGCLENLISKQDLVKLYIDTEITLGTARNWNRNVVNWCYEQREILAEEKIDKLSNER